MAAMSSSGSGGLVINRELWVFLQCFQFLREGSPPSVGESIV